RAGAGARGPGTLPPRTPSTRWAARSRGRRRRSRGGECPSCGSRRPVVAPSQRVTTASGGGRRHGGGHAPRLPTRREDAREEEHECADGRSDELAAQEPGRGVADELGDVAERLDLLA